MLSAPRSRSTSSVGAATESGVFATVSSRFIAVTVTSVASFTSRTRSTVAAPPASRRWSFTVSFRKPWTSVETVYAPGRRSVAS